MLLQKLQDHLFSNNTSRGSFTDRYTHHTLQVDLKFPYMHAIHKYFGY